MRIAISLFESVPFRKVSIRLILLTAAILSSACTPTIYKPDVQRLSADIDSATNSFQKLVADNHSHDVADRNRNLVDNKTRLALDPDCAKIETFIKDQNECLTEWSKFRQNASAVAQPICAEPVPFASIPTELTHCGIGKLERGSFVAVRIATANDAQHRVPVPFVLILAFSDRLLYTKNGQPVSLAEAVLRRRPEPHPQSCFFKCFGSN